MEIENATETVGGGATNAAVAFARFGLRTASLIRVGSDAPGNEIIASLKRENITPIAVRDAERRTAYSTILLSRGGERTILVYRGASEFLKKDEVPFGTLKTRWAYIAPGGIPFPTTSAIAATLFGNYLLALLIVIAAAALALHGAKEPPIHRFQLVEQGIVIGEELHPFERMASFSVLEDVEGALPPMLSVKTENWLSPHLIIPLEGVDADAIYSYFLKNVDEEEHHHTLIDLVAGWLGF